MPRYALELEWDGTRYAGTAVQPDEETLSSLLRTACEHIEEPEVRFRCSSRLDAGVSAVALPAHIDMRKVWDLSSLGKALNVHLPDSLAVRRLAVAADDWDALLSPSVKHYCYQVLLRPWRAVLDHSVWYQRRMDQRALLPGLAEQLVGEKDLSAFACLRGDETDQQDPRRHYHQAMWLQTDYAGGELWTFHIIANGFLYKQVRGLVGSMIAIAQGSYPVAEFERMLREGRESRQRCGNIAPAHGLRLERVAYQQEPEWQDISWSSQDASTTD